ncbi:MAG TPA: response regulator, partial [Bacteroidia bacterium]|nr:response regulator [Bacteroidia bacterium]
DLQMPYKDGFETFNEIRNPESAVISKDVPVIAITADAFEETRERVRGSGMNDYCTKPFNADELFEKIKYWLEQKRELV